MANLPYTITTSSVSHEKKLAFQEKMHVLSYNLTFFEPHTSRFRGKWTLVPSSLTLTPRNLTNIQLIWLKFQEMWLLFQIVWLSFQVVWLI